MSNANTSQLKKGVIRINVADMRELYQFYMPFIEGCGMFYPSEESYKLGQEVFVFLTLPEPLGKYAVSGRVVWLNPPNKAARRVPGVGIQLLGKECVKIRENIEQGLGKMMNTGLPTATL